MSKPFSTLTGLVAIALVAVSATAAFAATENVVLQWNSAMLQAIRNTSLAPMPAARGFAVLHTCVYDAWAAYDTVAVGTRLGGTLRRPPSEQTDGNKNIAVSFAAYRALVDLLPSQKTVLFDPLMASLGTTRRISPPT